MKRLLTSSFALLFSLESDTFKLKKLDPPFIYAENGVFEIVSATIDNDIVNIKRYDYNCDMPSVDWFVCAFPKKIKKNEDSANVVVVKNNDSFSEKQQVSVFANSILYKTWVDM